LKRHLISFSKNTSDMKDFETHSIGTKDRLDLMSEVVQAAISLRQIDLMTGIPIAQDSRRKAEGLLDDAIRDYEEFENER